jgi:hypothetical protein
MLCVLFAWVSSSVSSAAEPATESGLGLSISSAVEVCRPSGQRAYLERLTCPGGEAPRIGDRRSVGPRNPTSRQHTEPATDVQIQAHIRRLLEAKSPGPGETDTHIVDSYEVVCSDRTYLIYLDLYHCDKPPPEKAPPGFTLRLVNN